ncbi:hypothetical protein [Algoriphagus sp.]|uniref:hypothetical protein n=1 Tax=Algoriphagus sp. TaxID=1872435 RepID=UPI0027253003|nr:hypothetical protein [Algoriphagus sp.]MDO8965595.1 hypothetical protein [Algoriphagus sp.]
MGTLKKYFYENTKHKTQNTLILLMVLLFFASCTDTETENLELTGKVEKISEKYGFRAIPLRSFESGKTVGIHLKSSELEVFFNYLRKGKSNEGEINYTELIEIFNRNNFFQDSSIFKILVPPVNSHEQYLNSKVLCFQNSHLARIRVPNMPLPGEADLNGVEIYLGVGNGNLNSSSFGMYGFYPFLTVTNTVVNPVGSQNNTYGFNISYTVAITLFVDGSPFINYDNVNLIVRINACSGDVSWYYSEP